jgi:pilus assembly protein CpaB
MSKRVFTYVGAGLLAVLGAVLLAVSLTRGEASSGPVLADSAPIAVGDVESPTPGTEDEAAEAGPGSEGEEVADSADAPDAALIAAAAPVVVDVPERFMQISFALDTERSFAGQLRPGDLVGVFASYDEAEVTDLILQKVLVVSIREEAPLPIDEGDVDRLPAAPAGRFFVSLALLADDAETLTHALEFGRVWLSLEPGLADENAPGVKSLESVLTDSFDPPGTETPADSELSAADEV